MSLFLLQTNLVNESETIQHIINTTNNTASSSTYEITAQQIFKLMILLLIAFIPMILCFCACQLYDVLQKRRTGLQRLTQDP